MKIDPLKQTANMMEGEAGALAESAFGGFMRDPSGAGDFISLSGRYWNKVFDHFGVPKNVVDYPGWDISKFFPSIDSHILKLKAGGVDELLIDMRYMTSSQIDDVIQYIDDTYAIYKEHIHYLK